MKNNIRIILANFIIIFILSTANNAFSWGEVKKAKEFMQAGMYPQAIELLNKRINDKPADAEAHFQLGVCFIHNGNYSSAGQRFGSAVRLKSDYGYNIGGQYQKAATEELNHGHIQNSMKLFNKAISYQPDLKNDIAAQCKASAIKCLEKNKDEEAIKLFNAAAQYHPRLKEEIAKICYDRGTYILNSMTQNDYSEKSETPVITGYVFM
ncbi:MAG: hypothetical protein SRB2_01639 [Desulfobacteraceae bacterium Eth-SRB2]|nr:MAG: hypothetical protein SRB2_01639 [Desulfobacteraceae bacterium Eth-SRB2]